MTVELIQAVGQYIVAPVCLAAVGIFFIREMLK